MRPRIIITLCTPLFALACGDPGESGMGGSTGGRPDDIAESLRELGVPVDDDAPRVGPGGADLGPDDAPLSSRSTLDRVDELVIAGIEFPEPGVEVAPRFSVVEMDPDGAATAIAQPSDEDTPWNSDDVRATGAADLDGDGRDEVVAAYLDEGAIWLDVFDDAEAGFARRSERITVPDGEVAHLSLAAGDFDGDGLEELIVGHTLPGRSVLSRVRGMAATLVEELSIAAATPDAIVRLEMEAGRLDVDNAAELVVLMNHGGDLVSSWMALDDANTDFAEIGSGPVEARDETGRAETAVTAGLGVGDFDDDGLDEIAFGGVIETRTSCTPFPVLVLAIDDAVAGLEVLAELREERRYHPCSSVSPWRLQAAFVDALDVDGDGIDELHFNDAVYDDLRSGEWTETWSVNPEHIFALGDTHGGRLNPSRTAMAAGDFDADGFAEIAIYNENSGIDRSSVLLYGLMGPDGLDGFGLKHTLDTAQGARPELVAVNVDSDSTTISYDGGSYEFVFTEPVVIAVLAAPPCDASSNQGDGGCQTSFGQSEISGGSEARQVQTRVSGHVGLEAGASFFGLFEVKAKETITTIRNRTESWERSYRLEETITYTSGHLEDAVVFTTVPYDRYTYTILTHPDPDLVGTPIVVSLPRKPITLIAERDYYNAHVVEDAPKIDETILPHVPGDPSTYVDATSRAQLAPTGWLASDVVTVGQGSGSTDVTLRVSEEISVGGALETGWQIDAEVTGGNVILGWSVGVSETNSLSVVSGEATTYSGSVPSLDADTFEGRFFSFGLFTYVKSHQGREFQVLNYWVE